MIYDEFDRLGGCRKCQHFKPLIDSEGRVIVDFPDECYSCYEPKTKTWNNFKIKTLYLGNEDMKDKVNREVG